MTQPYALNELVSLLQKNVDIATKLNPTLKEGGVGEPSAEWDEENELTIDDLNNLSENNSNQSLHYSQTVCGYLIEKFTEYLKFLKKIEYEWNSNLSNKANLSNQWKDIIKFIESIIEQLNTIAELCKKYQQEYKMSLISTLSNENKEDRLTEIDDIFNKTKADFDKKKGKLVFPPKNISQAFDKLNDLEKIGVKEIRIRGISSLPELYVKKFEKLKNYVQPKLDKITAAKKSNKQTVEQSVIQELLKYCKTLIDDFVLFLYNNWDSKDKITYTYILLLYYAFEKLLTMYLPKGSPKSPHNPTQYLRSTLISMKPAELKHRAKNRTRMSARIREILGLQNSSSKNIRSFLTQLKDSTTTLEDRYAYDKLNKYNIYVYVILSLESQLLYKNNTKSSINVLQYFSNSCITDCSTVCLFDFFAAVILSNLG